MRFDARFFLFFYAVPWLLLACLNPSSIAQVLSATDTIQNTTVPAPAMPAPAALVPATPDILIPKAENILYIFDLEKYLAKNPNNKKWQYDVINLVSAIQGLVNRNTPQLYILYVREGLSGHQMNVDDFWLKTLRGGDNIISKANQVYLGSLEDVIQVFRQYFTAVALWDPNIPATGNVALTISGADSYLPLRYDRAPDSLFTQVVIGASQLPSGIRLPGKFTAVDRIPDTNLKTTSTQKGDAYIWAKTQYMDKGLCSPTHLSFALDPIDWDKKAEGIQYSDLPNCMIVNHDFYISKKSFFVDLGPWWNQVPTDIKFSAYLSGIDKKVLIEVLKSAYEHTIEGDRLLRVGGMVPWWLKYTKNHADQAVASMAPSVTETIEEYISVISAFNGIIDADNYPFGALANASVYQHIPLNENYFQNPVPPQRPLENKNYLLFVIGDFNSSALMYQTIPKLWNDISRGLLSITWAYTPIVTERIPHVINYMYETRTPNDFFAGGGTGAGLCFPNRFIPPREHSDLGNGLYFWQNYSKNLFKQLDLHATIGADLSANKRGTAFFDKPMQNALRQFSQQGVSTVKPFQSPLDENAVPYLLESYNFTEKMPPIDKIVKTIRSNSKKNTPTFQIYRFKLTSPTTLYNAFQSLQRESSDYKFDVIDPFTFFYLLRQQLGGGNVTNNYLIPTFLSNTIPVEMKAGDKIQTKITIRNDGWDIWNGPELPLNKRYRLTYSWLYEGGDKPIIGRQAAYIQGPVHPGKTTDLDVLLECPQQTGLYTLSLQFEQENVRATSLKEQMRVVVQ